MTSNLLVFDAHIAKIISAVHVFNIISFDFQKSFSKTPHDLVIRAVAKLGVVVIRVLAKLGVAEKVLARLLASLLAELKQ